MTKINKSAKTGKIVSKAEAKANPDETYETKVVKPKKVKFQPLLGEKFDLNGETAEVTSFDPLTVVIHEILNGCQSVRETEIDNISNAKPLTREEIFIRLA